MTGYPVKTGWCLTLGSYYTPVQSYLGMLGLHQLNMDQKLGRPIFQLVTAAIWLANQSSSSGSTNQNFLTGNPVTNLRVSDWLASGSFRLRNFYAYLIGSHFLTVVFCWHFWCVTGWRQLLCLVLVSVFSVVCASYVYLFCFVFVVNTYCRGVGFFFGVFSPFLAVLRAYFVFVLQRFVRLLASLLLLPLWLCFGFGVLSWCVWAWFRSFTGDVPCSWGFFAR